MQINKHVHAIKIPFAIGNVQLQDYLSPVTLNAGTGL